MAFVGNCTDCHVLAIICNTFVVINLWGGTLMLHFPGVARKGRRGGVLVQVGVGRGGNYGGGVGCDLWGIRGHTWGIRGRTLSALLWPCVHMKCDNIYKLQETPFRTRWHALGQAGVSASDPLFRYDPCDFANAHSPQAMLVQHRLWTVCIREVAGIVPEQGVAGGDACLTQCMPARSEWCFLRLVDSLALHINTPKMTKGTTCAP